MPKLRCRSVEALLVVAGGYRWQRIEAGGADAAAVVQSGAGGSVSGRPVFALGAGEMLGRVVSRKCRWQRTCVYSMASSGPAPLLLAVKSTQNTLHHLEKRA